MKSPCDPENRSGNRVECANLSFASKVGFYVFEKKSAKIVTCVIGISAVAYGVLKDNDPIFILGIVFVAGGYLLIRRKLKHATTNNP